jgi:hypothetical protein
MLISGKIIEGFFKSMLAASITVRITRLYTVSITSLRARNHQIVTYIITSSLEIYYTLFSIHWDTASVVYWSEFLATVPEVLDSIPGLTRFSEKWPEWTRGDGHTPRQFGTRE